MHKKIWLVGMIFACTVILLLSTIAGLMIVKPYFNNLLEPTVTPRLTSLLSQEEYSVYDGIIKAQYLGERVKLVVISDHTTTSVSPGDSGVDPSNMAFIQKNLPEVEAATLQNFIQANQQQYLLGRQFNLGVKYVLISKEEMKSIFEDDKGWSVFYQRYPDSQGTMTLSRVGFNDKGTQAVVYVGNQADWLAGTGNVYLLEKINGQWTVKNHTMVWIS